MALNWEQRSEFAQAALLATDSIKNGAVFPTWIDDHHFWYERHGPDGTEYAIVDARSGARQVAVPRTAIAAALASHLGVPIDAAELIVKDRKSTRLNSSH